MPKRHAVPWTQLATRIPKTLHRQLKLGPRLRKPWQTIWS